MDEDDSLEVLVNSLKDVSEVIGLELIAQYSDIRNKIIDNNQKNLEECLMIYQEILHDIDICLKQDISIDQRILLIDKEIEISRIVKELVLDIKIK